jgi:hypothetical protein
MKRESVRASMLRVTWGGLLTLVAALGSPRLNDYISGDRRFEGHEVVFFVVIAVVTILLFGLLARWAVRAPLESRRPATTGLVASILGLVGILAFFLSAPIVLGGLGATLGYEGWKRVPYAGGRGLALGAVVIGGLAAAMGSWLSQAPTAPADRNIRTYRSVPVTP